MHSRAAFFTGGVVFTLSFLAYHCSTATVPAAVASTSAWSFVEYGPGRCVSINARGDVVGIAHDNTPFVVRSGVRANLPTYNGALTVPLGIGDNGEIVGYAQTDDGRVPVRFVDAAWRALDNIPFGAVLGVGGSRLVGYSQDRAVHAFVWSGGATQPLPVPADRLSVANAANDSNVVVGTFHAPSGESHAFAVRDGTMTDLGTFGGANSAALAVNSLGEICGSAEVADGGTHGFIARNGAPLVDIGVPFGGTSSDARGIDSTGRVAANARLGPVARPFAYVASDAGDGGTAIDLLPKTDAGKRYASAHAAAMSSNGRIAGWAIAATESNSEVICAVWNPPEVKP